jgi:anhydro-N-acetylmuramic acid kinase
MACYIGLMSGTSLDGVDGVLADFPNASRPLVRAHVHQPFDPGLRDELAALNQATHNELHRAAKAAAGVSAAYAQVVAGLLAQAGAAPASVAAIGAHGQTVRHMPRVDGGTGYTLQLLDAARLAEATGLDVVCDFRSRDIAAGGQGAPLVPAAHDAWFAEDSRAVAVLNVGGIANLSLLPARSATGPAPDCVPSPQLTGFDCGPGNALMDDWCKRHLGESFDKDGAWAASGRCHEGLVQTLLADPFFAANPPKSTGRDLFNLDWLQDRLDSHSPPAIRSAWRDWPPADIQACLAELTARAAAQSVLQQGPSTQALWVCGGGARNRHVMSRLRGWLPGLRVLTTDDMGIPVDQVEALAFAWLARAFVTRQPGNRPAVTGARGPRILGALYPAA